MQWGASESETTASLVPPPSARQVARLNVASALGTAPELVRELVSDKDPEIAAAAARNPRLPVDDILRYAFDPAETHIREAIAGNPALPHTAQYQLAIDPDFAIRCALAKNPSLDDGVRRLLDSDSSEEVRIACILHQPMTALRARRAASDPSPAIRLALAGHPGASETVLDVLAMDANSRIRREVARNRQTSTESLIRLFHDPQTHPSLAQNPRTPLVIVRQLVRSDSPSVRAIVAARSDLDDTMMSLLVRDSDPQVVATVAGNPTVPEQVRSRAYTHLRYLTQPKRSVWKRTVLSLLDRY